MISKSNDKPDISSDRLDLESLELLNLQLEKTYQLEISVLVKTFNRNCTREGMLASGKIPGSEIEDRIDRDFERQSQQLKEEILRIELKAITRQMNAMIDRSGKLYIALAARKAQKESEIRNIRIERSLDAERLTGAARNYVRECMENCYAVDVSRVAKLQAQEIGE